MLGRIRRIDRVFVRSSHSNAYVSSVFIFVIPAWSGLSFTGCLLLILGSGIRCQLTNPQLLGYLETQSAFMKKIIHYIKRYLYQEKHRMLPPIEGGSGACGQDRFVHELLDLKKNGVFVDIGANDGVTISNTAYLEFEHDWTGVAVEPIPSVFQKLQSNRECQVINACITPKSGLQKFLEMVGGADMLSTLAVNNNGLTARRLRKNAKRQGARIVEYEVECLTFSSVMEDCGIREIDFLSVDTEGGELEILQSIDFAKNPVKVISVENNFYTLEIREFLEKQGFLHLGTFKVDEIYMYGGSSLRQSI